MKKILLYFIYITCVAAFFVYYLFPSDTVKEYIAFKLKEAKPDISLTISRVKPVFPPGLKFYAANLLHRNNPVIEAEQIKAVPGWLSLFQAEKIVFFNSDACEGTIKGKAVITKPAKESAGSGIAADAELSGLRIQKISAVKNFSAHKISGILNGNISVGESGEVINATLAVSDCNIGLAKPILTIENLTFKNIDAVLSIEKKKMLQIKECTFKGTQMNGSLSGTVEMKTPSGKSILHLSGNIMPHPSLIAGIGEAAVAMFSPKKGAEESGGIPFTIGGTLEKPEIPLFSVLK
jgi:type II secretion system protein N